MKKLLTASLLVLGTAGAQAQFGFGGQVNYITFPSAKVSNIGLGVNATFLLGGERPLRVSANYSFPKTDSFTSYAYALSSTTDPQSIPVNVDSKFSMINVWADYQKFFGDADWEDGGFYGYLGIGLAIGRSTLEADGYNTSLYSMNVNSSESFSQWIIRGGVGYEAQMDFGNLFGEVGLNLPANKVGASYVSIQMPLSLMGNVGYRYWFGA